MVDACKSLLVRVVFCDEYLVVSVLLFVEINVWQLARVLTLN